MTLIRNRFNYLMVVFSIAFAYLIIAVMMIYIDNIIVLSSQREYSDLRYLYISLRTVLLIGGIIFAINQYYNIMKSSIRDFCIMRGLGATNQNIRSLISLQVILLIIISIPIGLLGGYLLTSLFLGLLEEFSLDQNTLKWIASSTTFAVTAGVTCCFIISTGIYLERESRKIPLSDILSDNSLLGKEG